MNKTDISRMALCFLLILSVLLGCCWGILLATSITYGLAGIVSFLLHINKFHIKKFSLPGIIYFSLCFLPFGFFILLWSAFENKGPSVIAN